MFAFLSCKAQSENDSISTQNSEIVIINIEEGDRTFIGEVLMKIDSCSPSVIGIDSWFVKRKDEYQDSVLAHALSQIKNEIRGYAWIDSSFIESNNLFKPLSSDSGLCQLQLDNNVATDFTPIMIINGIEHKHISLQIAEIIKPKIIKDFNADQKIKIEYSGNLDRYPHINGSELNSGKHKKLLQNKIVLLGYIGPSDEDKFFTPMNNNSYTRLDTYGVVIIANQIEQMLKE